MSYVNVYVNMTKVTGYISTPCSPSRSAITSGVATNVGDGNSPFTEEPAKPTWSPPPGAPRKRKPFHERP